jgi:hypothetical protein
MAFAIKAEVRDLRAKTFVITAQKTMYGGKHIAKGDTVFVFASENEGGRDLIARGVGTSNDAIAKKSGVLRQTRRVSTAVKLGRRRRRSSPTRTLPRRPRPPSRSIDLPLFSADLADNPSDRPQDLIR